jgi:hypothetical protein
MLLNRPIAAFIFCLVLTGFAGLTAAQETTGLPPGQSTGEMLRDGQQGKPQKFVAATKEQAAAAIAAAKKKGAEVEAAMGVKFGVIETSHFIIFTDWDKQEYDFLKTNCEGAYEAVSKQFEIPTRDNVFIGKLPVYMFAKKDTFRKYAKDLDNGGDLPEGVLGYYMSYSTGIGHMAMWKPDVKAAGGDRHLAEKNWARVLTHEFTHAFVARYRTNGFIPVWLNEGLADTVANHQFPRANLYNFVRERAQARKSLTDLFEAKGFLKGEDYPVVQTVVEAMIAGNPKAFLPYFNDIKDGMKPEEALQKEYKTDQKGLESAWRKYVANAK